MKQIRRPMALITMLLFLAGMLSADRAARALPQPTPDDTPWTPSSPETDEAFGPIHWYRVETE